MTGRRVVGLAVVAAAACIAASVIFTPFGDVVTDTKDTWSRAGNVLTIVKALTAEGVSDTETAVFGKDQ